MIYLPVNDTSRLPIMPPLPFSSVVKRSYSSQSRSTATGGSPTPLQGYRSAVTTPPVRKEHNLSIPVSRSNLSNLTNDEAMFSPCCIRRSAVSSKDPTYVPPETSTSRRLLFERKYPPMPKLKSVYTEAKKAEYDGNIQLAAELYLKAIAANDRVDSSIKDYAGLLHMKGDTKSAIDFMNSQEERHKTSHGFRNLLSQLNAALERELSNEGSALPRVVLISIDALKSRIIINYESLRSLLPNCLKISKLTFVNPIVIEGIPRSSKVIAEFSSHSAARKAVMVSKHESVRCVWAPENLIACNGIIAKDPIQLVQGGPKVDISFANVPLGFIDQEWPKLLMGNGAHPQASHHPEACSPIRIPESTNTNLSPLAFSEPRSTRIVTPSRPRSMALDLTESHEGSSCASMDWCMNTPSPVKHMAGFF
jgi:hypothetical protein